MHNSTHHRWRLGGAFVAGAITASLLAVFGLTSQPDTAGEPEPTIEERLKRIEQGLFRRDSRLPESELESMEQLIRDLPNITVRAADDNGLQLDRIERVLDGVERKLTDIDRDLSRAGPDDLVRELDSLERELTNAERAAEDARRKAEAAERELSRLERRVSVLERKR